MNMNTCYGSSTLSLPIFFSSVSLQVMVNAVSLYMVCSAELKFGTLSSTDKLLLFVEYFVLLSWFSFDLLLLSLFIMEVVLLPTLISIEFFIPLPFFLSAVGWLLLLRPLLAP